MLLALIFFFVQVMILIFFIAGYREAYSDILGPEYAYPEWTRNAFGWGALIAHFPSLLIASSVVLLAALRFAVPPRWLQVATAMVLLALLTEALLVMKAMYLPGYHLLTLTR